MDDKSLELYHRVIGRFFFCYLWSAAMNANQLIRTASWQENNNDKINNPGLACRPDNHLWLPSRLYDRTGQSLLTRSVSQKARQNKSTLIFNIYGIICTLLGNPDILGFHFHMTCSPVSCLKTMILVCSLVRLLVISLVRLFCFALLLSKTFIY